MSRKALANEEIYEALLDDTALSSLANRLADHLDARSVMLHWRYPEGGAELFAHSGYFSNEQLELYTSKFAALDPWAQAAATTAGLCGIATDLAALVCPETFERSIFYNEYVRGMGDDTFRCIGVSSATQWGVGMIAVQRGRRQSEFSERQLGSGPIKSFALRTLG